MGKSQYLPRTQIVHQQDQQQPGQPSLHSKAVWRRRSHDRKCAFEFAWKTCDSPYWKQQRVFNHPPLAVQHAQKLQTEHRVSLCPRLTNRTKRPKPNIKLAEINDQALRTTNYDSTHVRKLNKEGIIVDDNEREG